jgi:hypothetical protein
LKLMHKGARKKRIAESSAEGMSAKDKWGGTVQKD